jgi:hypothetical protein
MPVSRYRILIGSCALMAVASLANPLLAAEVAPAAAAPQIAAEGPVSAPPKETLKADVPSAEAPTAVAPTKVGRSAAKLRAGAPGAAMRPRVAPSRSYRLVRYGAPRAYSYNRGGSMLMLGVAY